MVSQKRTQTHTISYVVTKWCNFICVKKNHLNFSHMYILPDYELRWNLNTRINVYCILWLLNDGFWNFHGKFVTIIHMESGVEWRHPWWDLIVPTPQFKIPSPLENEFFLVIGCYPMTLHPKWKWCWHIGHPYLTLFRVDIGLFDGGRILVFAIIFFVFLVDNFVLPISLFSFNIHVTRAWRIQKSNIVWNTPKIP